MTHPVYLVDDDEPVRRALSLLLSTVGIAVTGFADPQAFLARQPRLEPGCVIFDIRMPGMSGLKLLEDLRAQGVDWPAVIISGHGDIAACRRAFRSGAVDFLSKPVDEQDLLDAVQKGQTLIETRARAAAQTAESRTLLERLTSREREVLHMITRGFTTRQIAQALGLSPRTIESHRAQLGAKLCTVSQAEMTRIWIEGQPPP